MKELKFIEGALPKGFKPDFESFLFNEESHRLVQSLQGWKSYHLLREDKKKALAAVHFFLEGHAARSPYKAPFGSVQFSKSLQPGELYEFLKQVEASLKDRGIKKIQIKNPPQAYLPGISSVLEVLLLNLGYRIFQAEISSSITVARTKYDQRVEAWELRKLKQGKKAKLRFQEIPQSWIEEVYGFVLACREERQQSLSMTLSDLMRTIRGCPERFVLFGVYDGKELAAASIAIRINRRILYNFYSAHPRRLDYMSPVVSLIQGIYGWSQKQHIALIDLGTSSLEGQPNFSLLEFKFRLGGIPSAKLIFEKELS